MFTPCAREEKPSASSRQSRGRLSRAFTPASRVQRGSRALKPIHRTHSFSRTPRIRSHASPLAPLSRRRPANPHPRVFPHDVRADPPLASRAPSLARASIHPRAREITKSHARPRTCAPSAGPIGGAGDAFPASIASLMYPATFAAMTTRPRARPDGGREHSLHRVERWITSSRSSSSNESIVAARRRVEVSRARRRADASRGGAPRATRAANVYIYTPISSDTRSHHTRPIAHERTTTATGDDTHARWARVPVYEDEKDHRDHRSEARTRARAVDAIFKNHHHQLARPRRGRPRPSLAR